MENNQANKLKAYRREEGGGTKSNFQKQVEGLPEGGEEGDWNSFSKMQIESLPDGGEGEDWNGKII